jgi:hypothetical protein
MVLERYGMVWYSNFQAGMLDLLACIVLVVFPLVNYSYIRYFLDRFLPAPTAPLSLSNFPVLINNGLEACYFETQHLLVSIYPSPLFISWM